MSFQTSLQIYHVQAIHQGLGDVTHKSNNRQHLRTGSGHWHRTHITIKQTYQHCHKTYHLGKNLSEFTCSHSHQGPGPFRHLDEMLNQLLKNNCMEVALSCLYTK